MVKFNTCNAAVALPFRNEFMTQSEIRNKKKHFEGSFSNGEVFSL